MGWPVTAGATANQRAVLAILAQVVDDSAYLAGGVAVAARVKHRLSRDLDVFVPQGSPEDLVEPLTLLESSARIIARAAGTLHAEVLGVPISILRYSYPLLDAPQVVEGFALPLASVPDLVCMKLSAIGNRGARRDFWDLHELLGAGRLTLTRALELYRNKYPVQDIGHVVRSLVYFADAEAEPMPQGLTPEAWAEIRRALRERVQELG